MKWGVRRYQNKSGQLTSVGKKHYKSDKVTLRNKDRQKIRDFLTEQKKTVTKPETREALNEISKGVSRDMNKTYRKYKKSLDDLNFLENYEYVKSDETWSKSPKIQSYLKQNKEKYDNIKGNVEKLKSDYQNYHAERANIAKDAGERHVQTLSSEIASNMHYDKKLINKYLNEYLEASRNTFGEKKDAEKARSYLKKYEPNSDLWKQYNKIREYNFR